MAKLIYEFDYYEDREELELLSRTSDMSAALNIIYNEVRSELKHEEYYSDRIDKLLERIKYLSGEFN